MGRNFVKLKKMMTSSLIHNRHFDVATTTEVEVFIVSLLLDGLT